MCNMVHENSKILKMEKGIGYKIFGINNTSMVGDGTYILDKLGWARWKGNEGVGFCVFVDKKEALRCCALWNESFSYRDKARVKTVLYSGAVCEHVEDSVIAPGHDRWLVRLVKRFKVVENASF